VIKFRRSGIAAMAAVFPLVFVSAAFADPATAPATDAPGATPAETAAPESASTDADVTKIEEIVVTAQRREQKLQDVPVAVTAITTDQIESRGIDNLSDLNAVAPGLQISKTPSNSTISQITIRGVSQINPAIYWDPAVGIYLDGVYIGKAQGSIFDVVDLAAVEVLRGPQGTLYGRNTIGGTINLRSRAPTGQFDGSATVEVGNFDALVGKVALDLPKWGILSVSLGARTERRSGWVETDQQTSSVNDLNDRHNEGLRLAAKLDFRDDLQGLYSFDRSTIDQAPNFDQLYRADIPFLAPFASHDRERHVAVDAPMWEYARIQGHAFTLSWNVAEHQTIKSITGYRRLEWNDSLDLDGTALPVAFTQRFTDYDQFSQDLQLTGAAGPLNYVGGVYYFHDNGKTVNPQHFFDIAGPDNDADFDSRYGTKTKAWAAYGQVDWTVIDPLTVSAGVRYTHEKKELDRVYGQDVGPDGNGFVYLIPEGTHGSKTFHDTTPMFAINYKLTPDVNVYARWAEGFKSGGFNGEFSDPAGSVASNVNETLTPFKPEKQKSLEVGTKANLFDSRATVAVAAFHNKLKDLQTSIFLGSGAAATVVRNAGKATVDGAEIELAFVPVKGTQVRLNYAYLDPEYDQYVNNVPDGAGGFVAQDQADDRAFVHAPKNMVNAVIDSTLAKLKVGLVKATLDYAWTDSFFTYAYLKSTSAPGYNPATDQLADNSKVDAHGILNLRLALTEVRLSDTATGEFAAWCRNVGNDDTANNFIDFGPGFGNLTVANFEDPRTFGVSATVRF
jgi:iron complex outermembrane receptor protein